MDVHSSGDSAPRVAILVISSEARARKAERKPDAAPPVCRGFLAEADVYKQRSPGRWTIMQSDVIED